MQLAFVLLSASLLRADSAAFDLAGPRIEVRVTRAGKTLPIALVPNLQSGDRLWIHPDMPEGESVRFLMIPAFLRGSTNPPPENWFTKVETWNKHVRQEGIVITVPPGVGVPSSTHSSGSGHESSSVVAITVSECGWA